MINKKLPIVSDCSGCGVCCFHMGYPAFVLPRPPMTDSEIDSHAQWSRRVVGDPSLRERLREGHPGETYWHELPEDLRRDWLEFVSRYETPQYGRSVESLDGPCFWLDLETRKCKHHEFRPEVCRDFERGSKICLEWRQHYRERIDS